MGSQVSRKAASEAARESEELSAGWTAFWLLVAVAAYFYLNRPGPNSASSRSNEEDSKRSESQKTSCGNGDDDDAKCEFAPPLRLSLVSSSRRSSRILFRAKSTYRDSVLLASRADEANATSTGGTGTAAGGPPETAAVAPEGRSSSVGGGASGSWWTALGKWWSVSDEEAEPEEMKVVPQQEEARLSLRKKVLEELVASESKYVESLRLCQQLILQPLSERAKLLHVESHQVDAVVCNWPQLVAFHETLHAELARRDSAAGVSECFLLFAQQFSALYPVYVANYGHAFSILTHAEEENKRFRKFLEEIKEIKVCMSRSSRRQHFFSDPT